MLRAYYDVRHKDEFQEKFGGLWISQHPTSLQGKFQVMYLDFSRVGGNIEKLEGRFNFYLGVEMDGFVRDYHEYYQEETIRKVRETEDAAGKFSIIINEAKSKSYPLYLIIDEYDNFTNTVLNEHGEDVFITGVSPVALDDVTSGFNIGWHISTNEEFNQMLGFSTEDVREMFTYYKEKGMMRPDSNIEEIIEEMKPWYDNYCFSRGALETQSRMFNCDMVLYFLRNFMNRGEGPKEMIDPNTKTDYNKMRKLIQLDRLDGDRKGIIRKIAETGQIITR